MPPKAEKEAVDVVSPVDDVTALPETMARFTANCGVFGLAQVKEEWVGNPPVLKITPAIELQFDSTTLVAHLDPNRPADAEKIRLARELIANPPDADEAARVQYNKFRELTGSEPHPFPRWDDMKPSELIALVQTTGINVEQALRYELENQRRAGLVKALEALRDAPEADEKLDSVPEL